MLGVGFGRPGPTALDGASPGVVGARADCSAATSCVVSWEVARPPVRVYAGPTPRSIARDRPAAVARTRNQVVVRNRDPGAPIYFEVVARGDRRGPVVGDRSVSLTGAPNTRDLGGYRTFDGGQTRWGRLFRTDGLEGLTSADRARLAKLGLADSCPGAVDPPSPVDDATLEASVDDVTSAAARARDRAVLYRLADDPLPQWLQCTLLEGRTGWPAALVLATLGVGKETIVADHLLSARTGGPPLPDRRYIDQAFEVIRRRYGSFGRYVVTGLGLDEPTFRRLRARYVAAGWARR